MWFCSCHGSQSLRLQSLQQTLFVFFKTWNGLQEETMQFNEPFEAEDHKDDLAQDFVAPN